MSQAFVQVIKVDAHEIILLHVTALLEYHIVIRSIKFSVEVCCHESAQFGQGVCV